MKALLPADETERLKALARYEILDTGSEQGFDDITLLASQICGTPIALISLIDEDRQWFKSKVGMTETETSRDTAFCAHGILQPEVFEVDDARADPRFADNPLVTGAHNIRFYAGSPLITPDGHALGMLCVKDRVPRQLDPAQKAALQALSRQVVARLELRRSLTKLEESEERFAGAFEHAPIGVALTSPDGRWLKVNRAFCELVGYSEAELLARTFQEITYPEDLACGLEHDRQLLAGKINSYQLEKRYIHARGHLVTVSLNVCLVRNRRGEPAYFIGQIQDITERQQTEVALQASQKRLRDLIDGVGPSIFVGLMTPDGILIECNRPALAAAGIKPEDVLGKPFVDTYWWRHSPEAQQLLREAISRGARGEPSRYDVQTRVANDQLIDVDFSLQPLRDETGKVVFLVPSASIITERKQAESALRESQRFAESIAENSTNIIYIFDLETGRNAYTNRDAAESLGYSPAQILQLGDKLLATIVHPEDLARVLQHFAQFAEVSDNRIIDIEYRLNHISGETRWIWSRDTVFNRRPNGAAWQIMGTAQDITDRKVADAALIDSQRFLKSTLDALSSHIAILDEHGAIIEVNGAWNRFAEQNDAKSRLHGIGDNYLQLCDAAHGPFSEEASTMAAGIRAVIAGEKDVFQLEYPCHGPDEERWFFASVTRFEGDSAVRVVVAHEDISARKRAESELRESSGKLEAMINSVEGIVWEADGATHQINFISEKAEGILGYPVTRWSDEPGFWSAHLHPDDRERVVAFRPGATQSRPTELEYRMIAADGREVWFRDVISSVPGKPGVQRGLMIDITERKRSEDKLLQQQTELRILFDLMPAMVWFKNTENGILRVNQRVADAAGKKVEEIEGRPSAEIYPEDAARFYADDLEVIRSGTARLGLVENLAGPSGQLWVQTDKVPYRDHDGKVIGIVVMAQDITERKRGEMERQVISEIMQGVVTATSLAELLQLVHRSIGRLLYAENCFVGLHNPGTDLVHFEFWVDQRDGVPAPQSISTSVTRTSHVLRTGQPLLLTKELKGQIFGAGAIASSGSDSASWLGVPLRTPTSTLGVLAVQHYEKENAYSQRDLQFLSAVGDQIALAIERKQGEEKLKQSEERTRLIVATAHDAFIGMDAAGMITDWNPRAEETFGWSREEAIGRSMHELIIPEGFREMHVRGLKHFLRTGEGPILNKLIEVVAMNRDGREMPVEMMISPIRIGESFIFSASLRDITERRRAQVELKQAKEAAEAASRTKSEFLANMSHEIRTPMNGVLGMAGLLLDTSLTEQQETFAQTIHDSGEALLKVINDILDFSKIEAGKLEFEIVDIDVPHLVRGTMELLRASAEAKGLTYSAAVAPDVPPALRADGGRLRQVLINLLGNAIKFTAAGQVKLEVSLDRETNESAVVRFRIIDTGIGIPAETQTKLFRAFTQADGSTTRQFGGTGLGLAISRQLVEKMHGTLTVESAAGAGSTFAFAVEFPKQLNPIVRLVPASDRTPDLAGQVAMHPHRVLIAEDNDVNQRVASAHLRKLGYRSDIVGNGLEVMEALRRIPYDIILMDCQMPELDGYETTKRLRKKAGHQPYIIAMTAHAMQGDRKLSIDAGMDDYITKPLRPRELESALNRAPKIPGPGEGLKDAA